MLRYKSNIIYFKKKKGKIGYGEWYNQTNTIYQNHRKSK
jgi:hypothetical protein